MQRSHSMHVNLSVEDLEVVSSSSAVAGVTAATGRMNGTSTTRGASVGIPRSTSDVTILDIIDPRSYPMEKGKRGSRFQSENCVHMIPLVVLLCYFVLWLGSSGWNGLQSRWPKYPYLEMSLQEEQYHTQECLLSLDHQVHRFVLKKNGLLLNGRIIRSLTNPITSRFSSWMDHGFEEFFTKRR